MVVLKQDIKADTPGWKIFDSKFYLVWIFTQYKLSKWNDTLSKFYLKCKCCENNKVHVIFCKVNASITNWIFKHNDKPNKTYQIYNSIISWIEVMNPRHLWYSSQVYHAFVSDQTPHIWCNFIWEVIPPW